MHIIFRMALYICTFLCLFSFTFCLSGQTPKHNHTCFHPNALTMDVRIENFWNNVKQMKTSPDSGRMLSLMTDLKKQLEEYSGRTIDAERGIEVVFNLAYAEGIKIKPHSASYFRKLILKSLNYSVSHKNLEFISERMQVGLTITLCGFFITLIPEVNSSQSFGNKIISLGLDLAGKDELILAEGKC